MDISYLSTSLFYYQKRDYARALDFVKKGLEYEPENYLLNLIKGNIFLKKYSFNEAKTLYEKCIEIDPKKEDAYLKMSVLYKALGDKEKEKEYLMKASLLNTISENVTRFMISYYLDSKGEQRLAEELLLKDQTKAENRLKLAKCYNKMKMYRNCNDLLEEFEDDCSNASVLRTKVSIKKERGLYEEALNDIDKANLPNDLYSELERPILLYYLNKNQEALDKFLALENEMFAENQVYFDFNQPIIYFYIGSLYRRMGNTDKFILYMKKYKKYFPNDNEEYLLEMANFYEQIKNPQKEEEYIEKSLEKNEQYIPAVEKKINFLRGSMKFEEANLLSKRYQEKIEDYYLFRCKGYDEHSEPSSTFSSLKSSVFSYDSGVLSVKPVSIVTLDGKEVLIGEGGFGEVYLQEIQDEVVAVKRLRKVEEKKKEAIKIEALNMIGLEHPNIIEIKGFLNNQLIMEYAKGGDLGNLLKKLNKKNMRISTDESLCILRGIAKGLHFLHKKNYVHGDLKSSNVLLTNNYVVHQGKSMLESKKERSLYPIPKISDFSTNSITITHVSPERFICNNVRFENDIYSYGILIFEMFYAKENKNEVLCRRLNDKLSKKELKEEFLKKEKDLINKLNDCCSSSQIVNLFQRCIKFNFKERISIEDIIQELDIMLEDAFCQNSYQEESSI